MGYSTIEYTIQGYMSHSLHSQKYQRVIKKLKEARVSAGLRQVEVAQKLDKPQSYISKIERGERRIDVAELNDLARIYKKDLSYFVK